jgi:hypothetical protein
VNFRIINIGFLSTRDIHTKKHSLFHVQKNQTAKKKQKKPKKTKKNKKKNKKKQQKKSKKNIKNQKKQFECVSAEILTSVLHLNIP